ncbi:hypothetical protein PHMEG_00028965 [Phytophthora megakarya]|uniref:Uncharacterized protein n=1 Tax=Phytophthora megakarya TaxID=4795 RepID=A0A225V4N5_9STRA|nr:hypothetical protein PHMEG_00028965 [Phytophthora megakarya]
MAPSLIVRLPPRGYQVVYLGIVDIVIASLQHEAEARSYESVFENVGGESDDEFRTQSRVTSSGAVGELRRGLLDNTSYINSAWTPRAFSYLRSLRGGNEQEPHQNYPPSVLEAQRPKGHIPASMIFAFQENTKLKVFEGCFAVRDDSKARVIDIPVGFCVIFRGDLIHCGASYSSTNYRIHCYLAFKGMSWKPDIVSSVLPKTFDCQYCGLRMVESNKRRKHRRFCIKNRRSAENKKKRKRENDPLPMEKLV